MDMKVLKIYFRGTCQEMSAADGTEENDIFLMMKRIFKIKEDIQDFFLQDSEGRIVILPKHLPDELSLFLYVRPTYDAFSSNSKSCKTKSELSNETTPLMKALLEKSTDMSLVQFLLKAGAKP